MTISAPDKKKKPRTRGPLGVRSRDQRSREKSRRARGGGSPRRAANASKKNQRVNRASFKRRDGRRAPRAATTRGIDRSRARAVGKPYVRFRIQIESPASDAFDATRARAER